MCWLIFPVVLCASGSCGKKEAPPAPASKPAPKSAPAAAKPAAPAPKPQSPDAGILVGVKMATVSVDEVVKNYHRTPAMKQARDEDIARVKSELEERRKKLGDMNKEIADLTKMVDDTTLLESRKQTLQMELAAKRQARDAFEREADEALRRRIQIANEQHNMRMKGFTEGILKLIRARAAADNYDVVLDKSALSTSQISALTYSKDSADITDEMIKEVNKDAPPKLDEPGKDADKDAPAKPAAP